MKSKKRFNIIVSNPILSDLDFLSTCGYKYIEQKNIGNEKKCLVINGNELQYYFSDSVSAITKNNKYFVLDKCDDKCRVMISHNTNARAYKCYSNKDGQMFVPNTSIYTVPKGFTSCGFNEVLDFCTQLSLTLF